MMSEIFAENEVRICELEDKAKSLEAKIDILSKQNLRQINNMKIKQAQKSEPVSSIRDSMPKFEIQESEPDILNLVYIKE